MAEIIDNTGNKKVRQTTRKFLKVDMTPMVDLAFLLITFFIYTTSMAEPVVTKLHMPANGPSMDIPQSKTMTFLLSDNNKVILYEGMWQDALNKNKVKATSYHFNEGIGSYIRAKQMLLKQKDDLIVLIKPSEKSTYENLMNALDEMKINGVKRYAIVDISEEEKAYLKSL
jgi:biopolymer transport protein ExbD